MLRIADPSPFIVSQNRAMKSEELPWVAVPTKQDGIGYSELMNHPDGAAHYGAWQALLLFSAKCKPRWMFARNGRPLTVAQISLATKIRAEVLEAAIARLKTPEIGWLEETVEPLQQTVEPLQHALTTERNETERDVTRRRRGAEAKDVVVVVDKDLSELRLLLEGVARYSASPLHLAPPDATILRRIAGRLGPVPIEQFGEFVAAKVTAGLPKFRSWGFFLEVAEQCRHSTS